MDKVYIYHNSELVFYSKSDGWEIIELLLLSFMERQSLELKDSDNSNNMGLDLRNLNNVSNN